MTYQSEDGDGFQAAHDNVDRNRWQYSVASGCAVSINSGTLGQADTLSVASGEVIHGGSSVSVSAQDVQIGSADATNPRKDLVYTDGNGDAQVSAGTPEAFAPSGSTSFDTYRPAPPDLSGTDAVVLTEVLVPAGASSIGSAALKDRRVDAGLAGSDLAITTDVIRVHPLIEGGSRAGTFEEYSVSDHADVWDALQTALNDVDSAGIDAPFIQLPALGNVEVASSVTIPHFASLDSAPKIVGPGRNGLIVDAAAGFSGSRLIDCEAAGAGQSQRGLVLDGFMLRDPNGVVTDDLIRIRDNVDVALRDIALGHESDAVTNYLRITDTDAGDDWGLLEHVQFLNFGSGQTGLFADGNAIETVSCVWNGEGGDPNGTAIEHTGTTGIFRGDIQNAGTGIIPGESDLIQLRFEGGTITTPIDNQGSRDVTVINRSGNPRREYRDSIEAAVGMTWVGDYIRPGPSIWGGGNGIPASWSTTNVSTVAGKIQLDGSGGSNAELSTGTAVYTNDDFDLSDQRPTLSFQLDPSRLSDSTTRVGFVQSQWSDWAGIYYDDSGTATYHFKGVQGGSDQFDVDTGEPPTATGDLFTVSLGPGTEVGMALVKNDANTAETVSDLGTELTDVNVVAHLQNDSGGGRVSELWTLETRSVYGREI